MEPNPERVIQFLRKKMSLLRSLSSWTQDLL